MTGPHLARTIDALRNRQSADDGYVMPSHILLSYEYLRRLAFWTTTVDIFQRWWQPQAVTWYRAEIGLALIPEIRRQDVIDTWHLPIDVADLHEIGRDALYWACARDRFDFAAHYNLPDPYEPFLWLVRRGAHLSFSGWGSNDLHVIYGKSDYREISEGMMVRRFTAKTVRYTPYVELDEVILEDIDASLYQGLEFKNHDDESYQPKNYDHHDYLIYPFQE